MYLKKKKKKERKSPFFLPKAGTEGSSKSAGRCSSEDGGSKVSLAVIVTLASVSCVKRGQAAMSQRLGRPRPPHQARAPSGPGSAAAALAWR